MKFGSVCSGIEAASTAWHPLGWETAYVAEIEPFPCAVLAARIGAERPRFMPDPAAVAFPAGWDEARALALRVAIAAAADERDLDADEASALAALGSVGDRRAAIKALDSVEWGADVPNYGDFVELIAIVEAGGGPDIDLIVGGTPCQGFSIAGLRQSLADARGNLSLAFVRLIHAHARRPNKPLRWAVWENVPGVLSTDDNAFGCFLGGLVGADDPLLVPGGGRWPDAGMACGPLGRAAWRILDAQHFGLAQRRRRVFLVFSPAAAGGDPCAVLFERQGVPGHPSARTETGEGVAGTIAGGARQRGGYSADDIPLAATLTGSAGGVSGKDKAEGRVVASELAPAITTNPYGDHESREGLLIGCYGGGNTSGDLNVAACLTAKGNRQDFEVETFVAQSPIAFDTTQITSPLNRSRAQAGDPCHPLAAAGHAPAIAFQARQNMCAYGDQAGTLDTCSPQGQAIALQTTVDTADTLSVGANQTTGFATEVASVGASAVRRLTPTECERLQGFPDGHTDIMWKRKPAPDGPRYKALGNSKATTVVSWIGQRIAAYEAGTLDGWHFDWSLVPWVKRKNDGAPAISFALRGREGGAQAEVEGGQVGALRAANGGSSRSFVAQ